MIDRAVPPRIAGDRWIVKSRVLASGSLLGEYGGVAHFDGSKWSTLSVGKGLLDMDADSTGLWAVTGTDVLHGRDSLVREPLLPSTGLRAIHARRSGDQHVVGVGGLALRRVF